MNYDEHMTQLVDALTADKSLAQPYKNALLSETRRLHALIRGVKTFTVAKPPADDAAAKRFPVPSQTASQCTCKPLMIDGSCPVHGQSSIAVGV